MQNIQDELDVIKVRTSDVSAIQDEAVSLGQRLDIVQSDLDAALRENEKLMADLERQNTLYNELKKMRGRGEEMDMLQQMEHVR